MQVELERIEKSPSLKDQAYQRIKTLILSGRFSGGGTLNIDWLASQLGISRTPIREALLLLEQEGLVQTVPYKGTFVVDVSKKDVEEIYQVREVLEPLAVRLATPVIPDDELKEMEALLASISGEIERRDFECYFKSGIQFHDLVAQHCNNSVLQQLLGSLMHRVYSVPVFSKKRPVDHMRQSFREHCLVLDAIMERDVAKAGRLMAEHIKNSGKRVAELIQDQS